jgi:peptide subunit release factor 1 (eRF1)
MGEERVSHLLEEFLHDSLRKQVIGHVYGSPTANDRDLKEVIENALRNHKQQLEVQAVQELGEYCPDVVASGLQQVIEVCNLFLARRLFISRGTEKNGFVCRQHHYISLAAAACPFCGATLVPVSSVIDELVEIAQIHGIGLTIIEYRQDMMSKYDGIAGVTYVSFGHN